MDWIGGGLGGDGVMVLSPFGYCFWEKKVILGKHAKHKHMRLFLRQKSHSPSISETKTTCVPLITLSASGGFGLSPNKFSFADAGGLLESFLTLKECASSATTTPPSCGGHSRHGHIFARTLRSRPFRFRSGVGRRSPGALASILFPRHAFI